MLTATLDNEESVSAADVPSPVDSLPVAAGKRRRGRPRKERPVVERVHRDGTPVAEVSVGAEVVASDVPVTSVGGGTDAAAPAVPVEDGFSVSSDWSFLRF